MRPTPPVKRIRVGGDFEQDLEVGCGFPFAMSIVIEEHHVLRTDLVTKQANEARPITTHEEQRNLVESIFGMNFREQTCTLHNILKGL